MEPARMESDQGLQPAEWNTGTKLRDPRYQVGQHTIRENASRLPD